MNLPNSVRIRYEPLRSLSYTGISGTYAALGTPFINPCRLLKVTNFTDANLIVSLDGVTDIDVVAANGFYLYDFGSNRTAQGGQMDQPAGDRLYVRLESGGVATVGTVYATVIYASQV